MDIIKNDQVLFKYASERQSEILQTYYDNDCNASKTGRDLGITRQSVNKALIRILKTARKRGYSPEHDMIHDVPDGYSVSGISTLYGADGNVKSQWVKSKNTDRTLREKIDLVIDELLDDVRGKSKKIELPENNDENTICVYPLADMHIGMYAWLEETMNDYDCDIAEDIIMKAFERLVLSAPKSETALILGLGDWFHADTVDNQTLKSNNALDVDTRWQRVFRIGVRIKKQCIELALSKHKNVNVIVSNGNHDKHTSYAMTLIMQAYFNNNDRVNIDASASPFKYFVFGENLIGVTHGLIKPAILPGIMANDMAKSWGNTKYRTWYIGHKHHTEIKEYPGCVVEMFRTLAGKDSWHFENGYRSNRDIQRIVLHRYFGEIERSTVSLDMIGYK